MSKDNQKKSVTSVSHPFGKCGNIGCKKCFGVYYKPWLSKGKPRNMPHWMWLRWVELNDVDKRKAINGKSV